MTPYLTHPATQQPHLPSPGFADPIHDAQKCFWRMLTAMSYPGRPQDMRGLLSIAPSPSIRLRRRCA